MMARNHHRTIRLFGSLAVLATCAAPSRARAAPPDGARNAAPESTPAPASSPRADNAATTASGSQWHTIDRPGARAPRPALDDPWDDPLGTSPQVDYDEAQAAVQPNPNANPSEPTADSRGVIAIEGFGEVKVRPDSLRVRVGVDVDGDTAQDAMNDAAQKARAVSDALKSLGIPNATVQTQAVRLEPVRSAPPDGKRAQVVGYRARAGEMVTVTGASADRIGDYGRRILSAATGAGASDISDVELFLSDPSDARTRALQAAVHDAQKNASAVASAVGVRLLRLQGLDSSSGIASPAPRAQTMPVDTGELTIRTSVSARYAFAPR